MEEYLEQFHDFVYFLRLFAEYEYTKPDPLGPWYFQSPDSPDLARLRDELQLEEICGEGSQWDRLRRLTTWVHQEIRHDGSSTFQHAPETLRILEVCRAENRGVNCRLLATVLNELCLALGWRSRFVTCLPMGEDFRDCHVVTSVYVEAWEKWVFVDPTWDAYVEDDHGRALSLPELRNRYIRGERVHVGGGLNWNGEPGSAAEYLAYMAKNTFRFAANERSEYGAEGKAAFTQYWLHPMGYRPTREVREAKGPHGIVRRVYVSDPAWFWNAT
ncbi:MAG: transglutaminase-like domain-containing protein [Alicyclobacillus sp.]|nr:transglutaminase-like domain-containing protein [Alicyclobacillus sp.]